MSDGEPAAAATGRLLAAAGTGVGAVLLAVPVIVWLDLERSTAVILVTNVARVVAATMFLTAGAIRLARWWVTHEARSAYMGASLVVLGGVLLPLWHLARALGKVTPATWSRFSPAGSGPQCAWRSRSGRSPGATTTPCC